MHALYIVSVWLHVIAATIWLGGMLFLVLVVVPWLRREGRAQGVTFLRETGARFRVVGWSCFAVLLVTGTFNLWMRGVRLPDFLRDEWRATPFGRAVLWKLGLFILILLMSIVHDFVVGPGATRALARDPRSPEAERWRRAASLMGRTSVVLALCVVMLAVILVRGWPF